MALQKLTPEEYSNRFLRTPLSDIFNQSQCRERERDFINVLGELLEKHGYQSQEKWPEGDQRNGTIFAKDGKTVFISLVDDIINLDNERHDPFSWMFKRNDIIITDNYFLRPTLAKVFYLPASWYGIYLHQTEEKVTTPTKDFVLQINRIDLDRLHLLLEMEYQNLPLINGHVNVNCVTRKIDDDFTIKTKRDYCRQCWNDMLQSLRMKYVKAYEPTIWSLPCLNHNMDFETALHSGMLHICAETYSTTPHSLSLSEKTFRALLTPRPFVIYAGTHTIEYLEKLGFDVMKDLIEHQKYDGIFSNDTELKMSVFVGVIKETIENLKSKDWEKVRSRCLEAVDHNHLLLSKFRKDWESDSVDFLNRLDQELANG